MQAKQPVITADFFGLDEKKMGIIFRLWFLKDNPGNNLILSDIPSEVRKTLNQIWPILVEEDVLKRDEQGSFIYFIQEEDYFSFLNDFGLEAAKTYLDYIPPVSGNRDWWIQSADAMRMELSSNQYSNIAITLQQDEKLAEAVAAIIIDEYTQYSYAEIEDDFLTFMDIFAGFNYQEIENVFLYYLYVELELYQREIVEVMKYIDPKDNWYLVKVSVNYRKGKNLIQKHNSLYKKACEACLS